MGKATAGFVILAVALVFAPVAAPLEAAQVAAAGGQEEPSADSAAGAPAERPLPGVKLAHAIATATGIAITPLLGVGAVGAWQYFQTPEAERDRLPWFASTWFWAPAMVLVILLLAKEPLLGWVPIAKKPIDALEVLESKASALLATPAVIPMFLSAVSGAAVVEQLAAAPDAPRALEAGLLFLQAPSGIMGWVATGFAVLVFMTAFFCVWLAFHAINVLILLSPFGPLDMLLRLVKLGVLAVLVTATLVHAYLGLAVALLIVGVSIPLAMWSFRLSVFGSTLAFDLLTLRHRRSAPEKGGAVAFTAREVGGLPSRIRGRLHVDAETGFRFSYRRAVFGPTRQIGISARGTTLCRGALWPLVQQTDSDSGEPVTLFRLAPRYRTHEETLVGIWQLPPARDGDVRRGLKAAWAWLGETAGRGSRHVSSTVEAWRIDAPSG